MPKRVLDVGNCYFDQTAIREVVCEHFGAELTSVSGPDQALDAVRREPYDLVLVNRKLPGRGRGLDLIQALCSDPALAGTPVMLLSDYEEHQQAAVAAGALPGFGKSQLDSLETREKLAPLLGDGRQEG